MRMASAIIALISRRRLLLMCRAAAPPQAHAGPGAELVLAADQFIITPVGRVEDAARARAAGNEIRTVIAGYHWFTDWGRDTMISLEGLTLVTGRANEAAWILRTFAIYVRDGLIPNMFPEGEKEGLYHTADATLWFFHAIHRYVQKTGDRLTLELILPKLVEIIDKHMQGTLFGIAMDPSDALLKQGQQGYQLTWMDAKVDDWVVTPRRGKAVEINALWYNALCLMVGIPLTKLDSMTVAVARAPKMAQRAITARSTAPRYLLRRVSMEVRRRYQSNAETTRSHHQRPLKPNTYLEPTTWGPCQFGKSRPAGSAADAEGDSGSTRSSSSRR